MTKTQKDKIIELINSNQTIDNKLMGIIGNFILGTELLTVVKNCKEKNTDERLVNLFMTNPNELSLNQIKSLHEILHHFFSHIKPIPCNYIKDTPKPPPNNEIAKAVYLILKIVIDNVLINNINNEEFAKFAQKQMYKNLEVEQFDKFNYYDTDTQFNDKFLISLTGQDFFNELQKTKQLLEAKCHINENNFMKNCSEGKKKVEFMYEQISIIANEQPEKKICTGITS